MGRPQLRCGFAAGGRVPLTAHPVPQRNRRDPSRRPLRGLFVRPPPPHTGPRSRDTARAPPFRLRHLPPQAGEGNAFIGWALAHRLLLFGVPLGAARTRRKKPARVAGRRRVRSLSGHGWPVSEPPQRPRAVAGQDARRPRSRGCPSLWLLSLGQARESDSLAMDGERKCTGT